MPFHADLHSHTTASDGTLSPGALVALASANGVRVLAVTDHDTTAGIAEAAGAARTAGLTLVPGIEISADLEHEIHILGLFVDPNDVALRAAMVHRAAARRDRVRAVGERLAALGAPIDVEAVLAETAGREGNIGRPHLARALIAAGHVETMEEAFRRFLARDGAAYVAATPLPAAEAIALIHGAGGVASWAHPGIEALDHRLPELVASGLDALELRHPAHDAERIARYAGLAGVHGLALSGGADFHGLDGATRPGDHGVGEAALDALRARAANPFVLA